MGYEAVAKSPSLSDSAVPDFEISENPRSSRKLKLCSPAHGCIRCLPARDHMPGNHLSASHEACSLHARAYGDPLVSIPGPIGTSCLSPNESRPTRMASSRFRA